MNRDYPPGHPINELDHEDEVIIPDDELEDDFLDEDIDDELPTNDREPIEYE